MPLTVNHRVVGRQRRERKIYCGDVLTVAVLYEGRWLCARCGKPVHVVT